MKIPGKLFLTPVIGRDGQMLLPWQIFFRELASAIQFDDLELLSSVQGADEAKSAGGDAEAAEIPALLADDGEQRTGDEYGLLSLFQHSEQPSNDAEFAAELPRAEQPTDDAAEVFALAGAPHLPDIGVEILQDTFANRANYPAGAYREGAKFVATDRSVTWIARLVSGTMQWVYYAGIWRDTLANIPTASLGTNDAGLSFFATDYSHILEWGGAAWGPNWFPGDDGSDYYQLFEGAPAGYGANAWALCDGATVARLNPDSTTTNVVLDDVTTARHLKGGLTSAGVAAASGTTADATATNNASATGITVDTDSHTTAADTAVTGAGTRLTGPVDHTPVVSDPTHNHSQNAHNHAPGSLELANLRKRLYYRR